LKRSGREERRLCGAGKSVRGDGFAGPAAVPGHSPNRLKWLTARRGEGRKCRSTGYAAIVSKGRSEYDTVAEQVDSSVPN